jgi:hypothetical protein
MIHPFLLLAAVLLLPPGSVWLWREAIIAPGASERAINQQAEKTQTAVLNWLTTHVAPVIEGNPMASDPLDRLSLRTVAVMEIDRQATGIRQDLTGQLTAAQKRLFTRVDDIHHSLFVLAAGGLTEIDRARQNLNTQLAVFNWNAAQTMGSASDLMDTYAQLPTRVYESPAWRAIEPQITCKFPDGRSKSDCWNSSFTGLLGEAKNVGGVFTKRFPEMADAWTGMMQDGHKMTSIASRWAAKNVDPHPMTKKEKAAAIAKLAIMFGYAALIHGYL